MKQPRITRRDCAKGMMAAAAGQRAAAATRRYRLGNEGLEVSLVLDGGKVVQKTISNRLTGDRFELPGDEFQLEFDSGRILSAKELSADAAASSGGDLDLRYTGSREDPEVRVRYELPQGKRYLRKQISLRWSGERLGLLRADLDNWSGVKGNWASMHADRLRYGSHPIFCDTLWAGVEFPAAFNEYGREGFVLRSRPGGAAVGGEWVELHSTAAGAAEPGRVYEAFLEYIEDIRLAPPRLVACYNSWWTLPKVVRQSDNLALIQDLKAKMYDRFGVFFDIVTTDMGWSNPRTIWQIDRSILPQGFDDIRAIVEPAGAKLGLWMSPSEVYPPVCDYAYLEKQGYVVMWNNRDRRGEKRFAVSLADPKYRDEVKSQLRKLIRENGLGHIKYDGFVAEEPQGHDGLLPGKDSVEPLAAYSLELLRASKQEDPNLVTEPTYMNSLANYISPWILKYSDSVWGNSGGDCPRGIGPAPDYRESHTTAREYFIFSSQREFWLPQNAVHYFDIVHCDEGTGFANHAAMAFGRGRFFLSTYLNPKFMDTDDWRIYAGLLQWARKNRDLMRNTVMAPSRVELGEPYVYGHWLGMRGVLAVRNPSNETKDFALELWRAGAPKALADAVCYSQYPYRRGIASGLGGSSVVRLRLAPWELLFLEVAPRAGIREPVALGARWYREGNGMSIVADPETETVRLLEAGGGERTVRSGARTSAALRGEMLSETVRKLPESEWLMEKNERQPSSSFDLECSIGVPAGSRGKVLLLVEFPGRQHHENHCSGEVNGRSAAVVERSSAGHIGYAVSSAGNFWKDARAYESEWSWHICEVSAGDSRVRFRGAAAHPSPKLGVWLWTEQDLAGSATRVASSCPEPQMPQYREHLERSGICLKRPRQAL